MIRSSLAGIAVMVCLVVGAHAGDQSPVGSLTDVSGVWVMKVEGGRSTWTGTRLRTP